MYRNNKGKTEVIVVLVIITICILITSSAVILLKSVGKENVMYSLEDLGIIKDILQNKEKTTQMKEELYEFPYLNINKDDSIISINLSHEEKMIYYSIKKNADLNINEARAVIDLMKKLNMRYDYFIASIMSMHENNYAVANSYIYSITYPSYKNIYDTYMKDSSAEYRQIILRGVYFHYLANNYKYDDSNKFLTQFYMGQYEADLYKNRNESYNTYFSTQTIMMAPKLIDIYRYFLKSLV